MPQRTDAELKTYLDANIDTNYNREITGAKHNYWGTDIIDSKLNVSEIAIPANEIVYGSGFGISSSPKFKWTGSGISVTGIASFKNSLSTKFINISPDSALLVYNYPNSIFSITGLGSASGSEKMFFAVGATRHLDIDSSGIGLTNYSSVKVDTIETTLTDDDTHLPTSGAVYDAITTSTSAHWSRNIVSGYLYPTTLTDNVGIGTSTPSANYPNGFVSADGIQLMIKGKSAISNSDASLALRRGDSDTLGGDIWFDGNMVDLFIDSKFNNDNGDIVFRTKTSSTPVEVMRLKGSGNVGIGTNKPNQLLTVEGSVSLKETSTANSDTAAYGQVWVKSDTPNTLWFTDDAGGDWQLGGAISINDLTDAVSDSSNVFLGDLSGVTLTTGLRNVSSGIGSLKVLTDGNDNAVFGYNAAFKVTGANRCVAIGTQAMYNNLTSNQNIMIGYYAGYSITSSNNTAVGSYSMRYATSSSGDNAAFGNLSMEDLATGSYGTAIGSSALKELTTGDYTSALGFSAGRYYGSGTSSLLEADESVFLGAFSRAAADAQTNQIVIGYNAVGNGSNTATYGNSSITDQYLIGSLHISGVPSGATQVASGAVAGEVWMTSSHATLPDNVLMMGV